MLNKKVFVLCFSIAYNTQRNTRPLVTSGDRFAKPKTCQGEEQGVTETSQPG